MLRIAFWNIERGLELYDIKLFLTDKGRFMTNCGRAQESGE